MSRLPQAAFAALIAATVAAFFVTQHLKVTTPLLTGSPAPFPSSFSPGNTACNGRFAQTQVSFYLLHRADDVSVYVVDQTGSIIRTVASGRHMRVRVRKPDGVFNWDGREDNGSLAPDGHYVFRIGLIHQGRTIDIKTPIVLKTAAPAPVVTSVSPALLPHRGEPAKINYTGNASRGGTVRIYRTDVPGPPRLVKSFPAGANRQQAQWDGLINHRPAPAGTYLIGLDLTDGACNTGRFPPRIPPTLGSTRHAGVTVRYLAARPQLDPVPAGGRARASVYLDAGGGRYRWALYRVGAPRKRLAAGAGSVAGSVSAIEAGSAHELRVPLPRGAAGLYRLAIDSGGHSTQVPVLARASRRVGGGILVVLPALTWQGQNPVDDDGDGIPDTLDSSGIIKLDRPFAHGLPAGFAEEAALLAYLDRAHLAYDLTTDLGLIDGSGPVLAGHSAVVLAGAERWVPSSLASSLRTYVTQGGHVLSLGIDSLRRGVRLGAGTLLDPGPPAALDALGARPAATVSQNTALVVSRQDGLGIFTGTSGAFSGFSAYQPIPVLAPPAQLLSQAGVSIGSPAIVGYRLGRGFVVDIGLVGFGSSLASNIDAQELTRRLWTVLGGAGA